MPMAQVEVRLPVKIVRLLLTDLSHHLYGDEEDEFDEEGDSMEATLGQLLAGGRAEGVAGGGDWDTEEDQDLADEPASRLNLLVRQRDDHRQCYFRCITIVARHISKITLQS